MGQSGKTRDKIACKSIKCLGIPKLGDFVFVLLQNVFHKLWKHTFEPSIWYLTCQMCLMRSHQALNMLRKVSHSLRLKITFLISILFSYFSGLITVHSCFITIILTTKVLRFVVLKLEFGMKQRSSDLRLWESDDGLLDHKRTKKTTKETGKYYLWERQKM